MCCWGARAERRRCVHVPLPHYSRPAAGAIGRPVRSTDHLERPSAMHCVAEQAAQERLSQSATRSGCETCFPLVVTVGISKDGTCCLQNRCVAPDEALATLHCDHLRPLACLLACRLAAFACLGLRLTDPQLGDLGAARIDEDARVRGCADRPLWPVRPPFLASTGCRPTLSSPFTLLKARRLFQATSSRADCEMFLKSFRAAVLEKLCNACPGIKIPLGSPLARDGPHGLDRVSCRELCPHFIAESDVTTTFDKVLHISGIGRLLECLSGITAWLHSVWLLQSP